MSVDRAKAIVDYGAFCDNAFWQAMVEAIVERQSALLKSLASEPDLSNIYRHQGRVEILAWIAKLPEDLVSRLKK